MLSRIISILGHSAFWLTYMYLLIAELEFDYGAIISENHNVFWPVIYGTIPNFIIFYGTCFYLIPQYLNNKKKARFYLRSIASFVLLTAIEVLIDLEWLRANYPDEFYGDGYSYLFTNDFIFSGFVHLGYYFCALGYRLPIDRRIQEKREQELVREKIQTELRFLKAQIDPHTLFNGMNSIYFLVDEEPQKAKDMLLQFSALMLYQLYECEDDFVGIEEEMKYLRNYIAINKNRKGQDAIITMDIQCTDNKSVIAPLLFTPFIENAFKYLSHYQDPKDNLLNISLRADNIQIILKVRNTIDHRAEVKSKKESIGISNAINRLKLLYGKAFHLAYGSKGNVYEVKLVLPAKQGLQREKRRV